MVDVDSDTEPEVVVLVLEVLSESELLLVRLCPDLYIVKLSPVGFTPSKPLGKLLVTLDSRSLFAGLQSVLLALRLRDRFLV